ncbi:adenylyl-sulfate reductase [Magnetofaba australis]|uniref:adenylyl-sulfate reductase n=1 Tax=Magnetofaba australis TaxID=1472297 RepID=UPI000A19D9B7|nr:adenylyl-sulfate reductase [Magnetofaba australis]
MIGSNPFTELTTLISPEVMQGYVVVMFILVVGGTILDMIHKKSAKYFFANAEKAQKQRVRDVGAGEKISIAVQTVAVDVLTSAEFQNPNRRIAHIFKMYGFVSFIITTALLIFKYPTAGANTPAVVTGLWHLGAASICVGGYWFFFSLRVDVGSEGRRWHQFVPADMFIVSLLGTATFALLWSFTMGSGALNWLFFVLFILSATALFAGVRWSKFAHMFFKPAAAFQKRVTKADGSRENLPEVGDLSDPELQKKFPDIPEYMGNNPGYMGQGIKREAPRHF